MSLFILLTTATQVQQKPSSQSKKFIIIFIANNRYFLYNTKNLYLSEKPTMKLPDLSTAR